MKIIRCGLFASICLSLLFAASASTGWAADAAREKGDEKVYRLDKVIVRDHPLRDEAMVVTPQVTVINVDEYKKAGKAEVVQDILSDALGVTVLFSSVTPSQSEGIYVRGLDDSRFQIFMDGRPLRLHGSFGYFKMDWSTMPLDMVETIEVVRGSHSLLFPFSMGGAINLITKKGKKTDDPIPSGSVKTGFGPYGAQNYSAGVTGGLYNFFGYSVAAAHREGDGFLRGNDYNTDNVNGRFSLFLPTGGTITYGIDHVDTVTGYPIINDPDDPASNYDPGYPVVRAGQVDIFSHDRENRGYDGGKNQWERTVNDQSLLIEQPLPVGQLRGQIYKQLSKRDRYWHTSAGVDSWDYKEEYTGGIGLDYLDFNLIENHSLSVGGDYRNQGTPDNKDYYEIIALYIQDVWSITDAATLTFGTRWYEFRTDAREFITQTDTVRVEREWCPKARLDYDWDDRLSLYAAVSREMRLP